MELLQSVAVVLVRCRRGQHAASFHHRINQTGIDFGIATVNVLVFGRFVQESIKCWRVVRDKKIVESHLFAARSTWKPNNLDRRSPVLELCRQPSFGIGNVFLVARELRAQRPSHLVVMSTHELSEELPSFVSSQSAKASASERLPGSTDVLESCFGPFKVLEKDQSRGGFTSWL